MSAEFITWITVNGFLIIINCNELIKNRRLMPIQFPLICIGMSRFGRQVVLMIQSFFSLCFFQSFIWQKFMMQRWYSSRFFFFLALSVSDLSPAFLYFTVKISGFTQFYFVWLKFRISVLMPWLPLGRLLAFMSPAALCLDIDYPKNEEDDVLRNAMLTTKIKVRPINEVLLVSLTLTFPLAIFAMCTFMLLISL